MDFIKEFLILRLEKFWLFPIYCFGLFGGLIVLTVCPIYLYNFLGDFTLEFLHFITIAQLVF